MEPAAAINLERASRWIAAAGVQAELPLTFARIGGGHSNLTYEVRDAAGQRWIARRGPKGAGASSAHDVGREYRVLRALSDSGVPAPRALALSEDPSISDAPLLLMEYVDGIVVDEAVAHDLAPARRHALGIAVTDALARVHAVDLEACGLLDFASHRSYAQRQLARWRRQWAAEGTREIPAVDDLASRLERAAPRHEELRLVHGDFHILNLIFDAAEPDVRAIIDWELCTLGEPLADVGMLLAYWPQPDGPRLGGGTFAVTALPGFPTRAEIADAYAARSGRDIAELAFWETLGCWKIAIITNGVLERRRARGHERDQTDEQFDASIVEGMLDRAESAAAAGGI